MRRPARGRRALLFAPVLSLMLPAPASAHDPSDEYRWIGDDEGPAAREAELTAAVTDVWTADLQAVLSLASYRFGDGVVAVTITPRDAAALGELPSGLFADGNAYELDLAGDAPAMSLERPGQLDLAVPHDATAVVFSTDGERWEVVPGATAATGRITAPVRSEGVFLAVTDHAIGDTADDGSSVVRTAVLLGAPGTLLAVLALSRRRRSGALEPVST